MKPSEFFADLEEVGVPMDEAVLNMSWRFDRIASESRAHEAMNRGITWENTPQGYDYWNRINRQLGGRI